MEMALRGSIVYITVAKQLFCDSTKYKNIGLPR